GKHYFAPRAVLIMWRPRPARRPRRTDVPGGMSRGVVAGEARGEWRFLPMQSRRGFLFKLAAGFAAMALVVVGTVGAAELLGAITKVDVEGKKITVVEKGSDKEIDLKITDESKEVRKGEEESVDLEKLEKREEGRGCRQEGLREDHPREGRRDEDPVRAAEEEG